MLYNNSIMPTILIIEKNGNVKELTVKVYNEEEIYKKAGFKKQDGFKQHATWETEVDDIKYTLSLYGKVKGRVGQENKFEFPPPVDSILFFGNCIIVNKEDNIPKNITAKEWETLYDVLYGGFEEIGEEDSEESEEDDDSDVNIKRTKEGYVKDDGFIVDDDEEEEEEEDEDEDEDEDEEVLVNKMKKAKPVKKSVVKKTNNKSEIKIQPVEETYLDCMSELSAEEYFT